MFNHVLNAKRNIMKNDGGKSNSLLLFLSGCNSVQYLFPFVSKMYVTLYLDIFIIM